MDIIGNVYGDEKALPQVSDLRIFESNYDETVISYQLNNKTIFYIADRRFIKDRKGFVLSKKGFMNELNQDTKDLMHNRSIEITNKRGTDVFHWEESMIYAYLMLITSVKKYFADMDYYDVFNLLKDSVFVDFIKREAERTLDFQL